MYGADDITQIGVAGAGVMGQGIAQLAAQTGYAVVLYDPFEKATETAAKQLAANLQRLVEKQQLTNEAAQAFLARIHYTNLLEELRGQLIIEAVPEQLPLKHQLLGHLQAQLDARCILATNTSTLPITQIASVLTDPSRCVGMHFFNPAPIMKLVEVIAGVATAPGVAQAVTQVAQRMGKTAVQVADTPGFIVNRVARQYYLESLRLVEEGTASPKDIDQVMEALGFKMGPFKLMDLIGVETNHSVSQSLYQAFMQAPRFRPSRLQQQLVDAGHWGRKRGRGFYEYSA